MSNQTVTLNTPAWLVGQRAEKLFDAGLTGNAAGAPTGVLGSTITLPTAYVAQAIKAGFTYASWAPGT